jgi:hypothetical protein
MGRIQEGDAYLKYSVFAVKSCLGRRMVGIGVIRTSYWKVGLGKGSGRGMLGRSFGVSTYLTAFAKIKRRIHECWNSTLTSLIKSLRHETKRE